MFMHSKINVLLFVLLLVTASAGSQTMIYGRITDAKKNPLPGISIGVKNSYDGGLSDSAGHYSFLLTQPTDSIIIYVSGIGYKKTERLVIVTSAPAAVDISLKEELTELQVVVISVGSFEASDKKRNTVLKPLDIVTTAGQQADVVAALRTLPGAQQVGEQEGLFIRGGAGYETKVFIDGMAVSHPFYSNVPDIAQRGRYSPLLFKGTHFSSGGYSALYGQGLSSALKLETHDLPSRTETNMIVSSPQLTFTRLQVNKKKTASAGFSINYNNLEPYFNIVPQKINYTKTPEIINGEILGRLKTKGGLIKYYGYANYNIISFNRPSVEGNQLKDYFHLTNRNIFSLLTITQELGHGWKLSGGAGFSYNKDVIEINNKQGEAVVNYFHPQLTHYSRQLRAVLSKNVCGISKVHIGAEHQYITDKLVAKDSIPFLTLRDCFTAAFLEADLYVTSRLTVRPGLRYEYSRLLRSVNLAPRIAAAYKFSNGAEVSAAWGEYYQKPETNLLFRSVDVDFARAVHYILNYQKITGGRSLRAEVFYKQYQSLISYQQNNLFKLTNAGKGYAQGFELFWRDKTLCKNFDYWIAYSYLDTKRQFLDYPSRVQPSFAAKHTLNVVAKQFVEKIATQVSLTYTYASGRPFYNPNTNGAKNFMTERTIAYHNTGFQVNVLTKIGKANAALILNINNVFGNEQVFGYRFATNKNNNDEYNGEAVTPMAKRFYFIGAYISIGNDRRKEIIDN